MGSPVHPGPGGRLLVRGAVLLTMDQAVGTRIAPAETAGAEVVEVPDAIVLPGFADTHRHTWQAVIRNIAADWTHGHYMTGIHAGLSKHFQPEDTYTGNLLG